MAKFLKKLQAELALYKLVKGDPAFADFHIEEVLKGGPDQVTAVATWNGDKVVVKRSLGAQPDREVLQAKEELDILARIMAAPPYRINECLAVFPQFGIIVLSFVPGVRLDHAIRAADLAERATLMRLSGGWLKSYTSGRSDMSPKFSPDWWIKKQVAEGDPKAPEAVTIASDAVLDAVKARVPDVRGQDVTKAAVHGDFASINAHYHVGCIYGGDVQGKARLPVGKDVSRFLVWTQLETPLAPPLAPPEMTYVHGIAAPDMTAFLDSGVLPATEVETLLPFFIGLQLLSFVQASGPDRPNWPQVEQMVARYTAG